MKLSFHNHTDASWDCRIALPDLEALCLKRGIDAITITDHNEIKGALAAAKQFRKVKVIVGEEINTTVGEVVGIFLTHRVEPGLSLAKTVTEIHSQGGLVVVVHPFDRLRSHVLETAAMRQHLKDLDIIEVFNSRTVFEADNRQARAFAAKQAKPMVVGNDAHTLGEVGASVIELPPFAEAKSFLTSLRQATFSTGRSPLWVHGVTKFVKWSNRSYESG